MTDDELRRLIAGEFHPSWLVHGDILELARDALRFRHIIRRNAHVTHDAGWVIRWRGWDEGMTIRAAIDADMEASR